METGQEVHLSEQASKNDDSLLSFDIEISIRSQRSAIAPIVKSIIGLLGENHSVDALRYLELGLDEAIRNAYEHGNLEINSELKGTLLEDGTFDSELSKRERQTPYCERGINLKVKYNPNFFHCTIEDQGKGFNWHDILNMPSSTSLSIEELHGRGIMLIQHVFDTVVYNEKGNKVELSLTLE